MNVAEITRDHTETALGLIWMLKRFKMQLWFAGILRNAEVKKAIDTANRILNNKPVSNGEVLNMCDQVKALTIYLQWKATR